MLLARGRGAARGVASHVAAAREPVMSSDSAEGLPVAVLPLPSRSAASLGEERCTSAVPCGEPCSIREARYRAPALGPFCNLPLYILAR